MKHLFYILLLLLVAYSCIDEPERTTDTETPLVIEGWISEGEAPVVMVTHAIDLDRDSADFSNFIEKWGRVSVFDGESQYLLTGHINKGYLPSLIFTTNHLKGKPGHSYRVRVETEQGNAEAAATLLPLTAQLVLEPQATGDSDSTFTIRAYVTGLEPQACYKFYVKTLGSEEHYYPAFKATFRGCDFPHDGFVITKMQRIQFDTDAENRFSHYFRPGEVVQVRLCRIQSELYEFWRNYDNTVALGSNMLLTFADNCPGNIDGAYGYWQPAGAITKAVRIP